MYGYDVILFIRGCKKLKHIGNEKNNWDFRIDYLGP